MLAKSIHVIAPRRMEVRQIELPNPRRREIMISVQASGICHSDMGAYDGSLLPLQDPSGIDPNAMRLSYPYTLGHEPVGIVEMIGEGVETFKLGDRVSGAGWVNLNHSFSSYAILHEDYTVHIPDNTPFEHALAEPLGAAINIVRTAGVEVGDRVAVVGCGFMGLLVISLLTRYPVRELIAVDIRSDRLLLASELGATSTVCAGNLDDVRMQYESLRDCGVDVVVELSGRISGLKVALQLIKKGRRKIVMSSTYLRSEDLSLGEDIMMKAPQLLAVHPDYSLDFKEDMRRGMWALEEGVFPMERLITHRYSLENCGEGHEMAYKNSPGYIKGVVIPL